MIGNVTSSGFYLAQENRNALLANAQYPRELRLGLDYLQEARILTQENRGALLVNAQYARNLGLGLTCLHRAGLLTQENRNALLANAQYVGNQGLGLDRLQEAGLLTQENFDALLANAQYAVGLGEGLTCLHRASILTQENRNALLANAQYARELGLGLFCLHRARILTQKNFETLLLGKGAHAQALVDHYPKLVNVTLTQERFDRLMESTWGGARLAATMLGSRNRDEEENPKLPLDVIAHIASFLMPDYSADGEDKALFSVAKASERAGLYSAAQF